MANDERTLAETLKEGAAFGQVLSAKAQELANRLYERRKKMLERVGEQPYGSTPMSRTEQIARYAEVRENPERLARVLAQSMHIGRDGRPRLPKRLVTALTDFEQEIRRGTL